MSTTTQTLKRCLLGLIALLIVVAVPISTVQADRFDEQIRAIENEVSGYQAEAGRLRAQSDTLASKLGALTAQKNAIQAQINLSQAQYDQLSEQIKETERKIESNKLALTANLRNSYVESSITQLEMVASSRSISDFIDKQEYRNKIRESIQRSIKEIRALKERLAADQKKVAQVLADQQAQREQLAVQEAEQANLLAETQGQESAYQRLIGQKNSQISSLRAEQAAANRSSLGGNIVAGDPGRGGYPSVWHNAPQDSMLDNWGMYNRECVSYTAWKVYQSGRHMPYWGGHGNANQWPDSAQADGIATGSTPRVGAVAISMSGFYGHSMYVEAVNGNSITVSQYNYSIRGEYSEMTISGSGLVYIYF